MRSVWLLVLAGCGGSSPAPTAIGHAKPSEELRSALVRELGRSAYLTGGASGLIARGQGEQRRVLVGKPLVAAAYDASLDLAFFTIQKEAGVWSLDMRTHTAEAESVVATGNGDFAVGWFDGRNIASNTEAINISIDLARGTVRSTRAANEDPLDKIWTARMRPRERRTLPSPITIADRATVPFGKTGLQLAATEAGIVLRQGERAAAIDAPTKWLALRSKKLDPSCAVVELDSTEQRWFASGKVCDTSGCTSVGDGDIPIAWLEPGPVVRPACAGTQP